MTVSIYKQGEVWYLDYYYQGKRRRISTRTRQRKLAEVMRQETEVKLFRGELVVPGLRPESINDLIRKYLAISEKTKARSTYKTEAKQLKAWGLYFNKKAVNPAQLTPALISDWQSRTNLSHRSQNNMVAALKAVLNKAVEWGVIAQNPIRKIKPLRLQRKLRLYSDVDIETMLAAATPDQALIICLGAYAGLRLGEMLALRWRDINLISQTLTVRSDDEFTPKGKRGRTIPLHNRLKTALQAYGGARSPDGLVMPGFYDSSKRRGQNWPSVRFKELSHRLKIKGRLHDLRHTFGSRLVRAGVPLPVVRDLMGHTDIASTMIYVHVYPEQYRDAINKL